MEPDQEPDSEELAGVSGGLDDVTDLAGPGSTMLSETIGLSIDGARLVQRICQPPPSDL